MTGTLPSLRPFRATPVLFAALATAACAAICSFRLGEKSLWLDELFSIAFVREPWPVFFRILELRDANMSFYYIILKGWARFGDGEAMLRVPSVLFAVASVPALFLLGRRLVGERSAAVACWLLALSGFLFRHAREARGYSLVVLLLILAALALARAGSQEGRRGDLAAFVLLSALAAWAHAYALLATAGQLLALSIRREEKLPFPVVAGCAAGWLLLVSPLCAFLVFRDVGQIDWIRSPFPMGAAELLKALSGRNAALIPLYLALVPMGALALRKLPDPPPGGPFAALLLFAWLVFPPLVSFSVSVFKPVFNNRYLIVILPPFLLLAARGLEAVPRPVWRRAALVALVALTLAAIPSHFRVPSHDWRGAFSHVFERAKPGDGIFFHRFYGVLGLSYYRSRLSTHSGGVPEITYPDRFGILDYAAWRVPSPDAETAASALARHPRVWLFLSGADSGPGSMVLRDLREAFSREAVLREETDFTRVRVLLYERK